MRSTFGNVCFALALFFLFLPVIVFAQDTGLVACKGAECQLCHVGSLITRLITFIVSLSPVVAAIGFSIAAFFLITSAGNASKVIRAKEIFKSIAIGLAILIGAWLLVDTVIKVLTGDKNGLLKPWQALTCVDQPRALLGISLRNDGVVFHGTDYCYTGPDANGFIESNCFSSREECEQSRAAKAHASEFTTVTHSSCIATQNVLVAPTGTLDLSKFPKTGYCGTDVMAQNFGQENAARMSCICIRESGTRSIPSTIDVMWHDGNRAFSFGLFQINLAAHKITCTGHNAGQELDCPSAFAQSPNDDGRCRWYRGLKLCPKLGYGKRVVNEALYKQCTDAALDPKCNLSHAAKIFQSSGYKPWVSSSKICGI